MSGPTEELQFTANDDAFTLDLTFADGGTSGVVTGISGTVDISGTIFTVTGLDSSYQGADNTITASYPFVDYNGLSFDTSDGNQFNYYDLNGYADVVDQDYFGGEGAGALDVSLNAVCYLRGTHLSTPRGEIAVEDLNIGDLILTAAGESKPIRWIGTRAYAERFVRNNAAELAPVCFRAGSLEEGVPARDLYVSPRHAMSLDGVLIEARHLLNGATIFQPLASGDVAYFHIELDGHDVLVAEGAAAESYFDDDNRFIFQNARSYVGAVQQGGYCAPRVEDGHAFEQVRRRLRERAGRRAA